MGHNLRWVDGGCRLDRAITSPRRAEDCSGYEARRGEGKGLSLHFLSLPLYFIAWQLFSPQTPCTTSRLAFVRLHFISLAFALPFDLLHIWVFFVSLGSHVDRCLFRQWVQRSMWLGSIKITSIDCFLVLYILSIIALVMWMPLTMQGQIFLGSLPAEARKPRASDVTTQNGNKLKGQHSILLGTWLLSSLSAGHHSFNISH